MTTHTLEISPSRGYVVVLPLFSTTITVPTSYSGIKIPWDRRSALYDFVYVDSSIQPNAAKVVGGVDQDYGWSFNNANLENVTELTLRENINNDPNLYFAINGLIDGKNLFIWNYDYPNEWVIYNVSSTSFTNIFGLNGTGTDVRDATFNVSFYSSSVTSWTGTGNLVAGYRTPDTSNPAAWAGDSNTPLTITGTKDQINAFLQTGEVKWYDYPDDFYTLSERYVSPATTDVTLDYTVIRNGVRDTSFPVVLNLYVEPAPLTPDSNPNNFPV